MTHLPEEKCYLYLREAAQNDLTGGVGDMRRMTKVGKRDITSMLVAWKDGDADALNCLMDIIYPELRRIAHGQLARRRPGESLESAALANETYLKLVRAGGIRCENRVHFLALCSQIMRRVLVDHARRRGFAKRGGHARHAALDEALVAAHAGGIEVLALNEALDALACIDHRKCRVVELRYFGGLNIEETAAVLGVSVDTVKRDWRLAKAWLFGELTRQDTPAGPQTPTRRRRTSHSPKEKAVTHG